MTLYSKITRFNAFIFLGFALFFTNAQAKSTVEPLNKVVAIVNNMIITQNELDKRIKLAEQQNVVLSPQQGLEELITEQLQLQRANEMRISINDAGADKMMEHIAKQNNITVSQLIQAVQKEGLALEDYKNNLKTQQLISHVRQKEVLEGIEVSEQEVAQFLKSANQMAQSQNATNAQYRIGHILIPLAPLSNPAKVKAANQEAQTIIQKLKTKQSVALNDLGWRKMTELPTLFLDIVPSMNKQDIHGPIQNESGLHIIQLLDKKDTQTGFSTNPETQKQQVFQIIKNRKASEKLSVWLQKLRNEAYVQIYLEDTREGSHAQTP